MWLIDSKQIHLTYKLTSAPDAIQAKRSILKINTRITTAIAHKSRRIRFNKSQSEAKSAIFSSEGRVAPLSTAPYLLLARRVVRSKTGLDYCDRTGWIIMAHFQRFVTERYIFNVFVKLVFKKSYNFFNKLFTYSRKRETYICIQYTCISAYGRF